MTTTKKTFKEFILNKLSNVDLTKQNKLFYYYDMHMMTAYLLFIDDTFSQITRLSITVNDILEVDEDESEYPLYGDIHNLYSNLIQVIKEQISIINISID
jgi:hypothetical protein